MISTIVKFLKKICWSSNIANVKYDKISKYKNAIYQIIIKDIIPDWRQIKFSQVVFYSFYIQWTWLFLIFILKFSVNSFQICHHDDTQLNVD